VPWQWPVGALCAFLLTLVTTPAGVSGAVLLLPIQLSVLHVPSPAVTPTNLLFNVAAVPGGLLRFWHERRLWGELTGLLVAGTLPGVIAGAVIRVQLLSASSAFTLVAAGVLLPLGLWLALGSQRLPPVRSSPSTRARRLIWVFSLAVGTVWRHLRHRRGVAARAGSTRPGLFRLRGRASHSHRHLSHVGRRHRRLPGAPSHPRRHDCPRLGAGSVPRRRRLLRQLLRRPSPTPLT
jgi:hypothetical protein